MSSYSVLESYWADKVQAIASNVSFPTPIADRNFSFSNETLALMSDAEIAYARLDALSVRFPYKSALRRALLTLEALSTICVDGVAPDLETMLILDAINCAEQYSQGTGIAYRRVPSDKERAATLAAIRYRNVVQDIAKGPTNIMFDRSALIRLHRDLMYSKGEIDEADIHFRQKPYQPVLTSAPLKNLYVAPKPELVPILIDDLMNFCNEPNLSPIMQAAVAHFYLEAIRPFKTAMDRTGRAFCHMIIKRRHLYDHLVPPIALVPAMDIPIHAELLFPYKQNKPFKELDAAIALDRWTNHCGECLVLSVRLVRSLLQQIGELEAKWNARLPGLRKGSAADIMLRELPGSPIVTVATVMETTGKSFSASNDAVRQLVEAGILTPLTDDQRNRVFESPEAMKMLYSIPSQTIPTRLVPRESIVP